MLEHGGGLISASRRYGTPANGWLDLSTGINPHIWQGATPSAASWQRLPEPEDGLIEAAREYYGARHILPVPGTQVAIQLLPQLRAHSRVGVYEPSYAEHAHRWRLAGHAVTGLQDDDWLAAADRFDVLSLCNPNNPTGARYSSAYLLQVHERLLARGGWLIVDEAYIDPEPGQSLAAHTEREGLIVLRSFGKFFGLAGARVGFVLAWRALLEVLADRIGPWAVNGPAREIAQQALRDRAWQSATCSHLEIARARLVAVLQSHGFSTAGGCALFQWIRTSQADRIQRALAAQGILLRRFDSPDSLRIGLPSCEHDWRQLDAALAHLKSMDLAA